MPRRRIPTLIVAAFPSRSPRYRGTFGKTREWRGGSLRAYQRRTRAADALIAGTYLAGTNTRRVRRALAAVFAGPVGKDVVSRAWRKTRGNLDALSGRFTPILIPNERRPISAPRIA